jgi:hypothetical protein
MLSRSLTVGLVSALVVGYAEAFFRINCANIQVGRIDPIVTPGKVSAHVHTGESPCLSNCIPD